jgi:hypothetical protein
LETVETLEPFYARTKLSVRKSKIVVVFMRPDAGGVAAQYAFVKTVRLE